MLRLLLLLAACSQTTTREDLSFGGPSDLSVAADLSFSGDLAGSDLARRDMAALPDLRTTSSDGPTGGVGQCWKHSQCPAGTCSPEAPGGICLGCGNPSNDCPAGFDICATGAACSISCGDDNDCVPGSNMVCTSDFSGNDVCALRSCSGVGSCGPLYECRSGFCRRVLCPSGSGCPAGTTCRDSLTTSGMICVEDHLSF